MITSRFMAPLVLLVEDSPTYAAQLTAQISASGIFRVEQARTLAEARSILESTEEEFFAAICDLHLPDANGAEIVDTVLKRVRTVLVMTAAFDENIRQEIIGKNIADYVLKESQRDIEYVAETLKRLFLHQDTKVLLVDDSATYRHVLNSALRTQRYEVLVAETAEQALQMVDTHPDVRLVITDFQMPGMDGVELVRRIRSQFGKNELAIIGLSAQGGDLISARFLKKGANDFLTKPFSKEEFFCRVNQNLEMIELFRKIRDSANRDYLTGLYNRRYFFDIGERFYENARRNNLALSAAMIDIDFFKSVNDSFGHDAGDQALRQVAESIQTNLRKADILARFGGEEFGLLAINIKRADMEDLLERLRAAIESLQISSGNHSFQLTISIGASHDRCSSLAEMLNKADACLYEAKRAGRNCVVVGKAPDALPESSSS